MLHHYLTPQKHVFPHFVLDMAAVAAHVNDGPKKRS